MRDIKLLGPAPAAMTKRAARYHAQLLHRGARIARRCIACSTNGCRAWKKSRRRATCAGRSTSIRSISSSATVGTGGDLPARAQALLRVFLALRVERRAFACALR